MSTYLGQRLCCRRRHRHRQNLDDGFDDDDDDDTVSILEIRVLDNLGNIFSDCLAKFGLFFLDEFKNLGQFIERRRRQTFQRWERNNNTPDEVWDYFCKTFLITKQMPLRLMHLDLITLRVIKESPSGETTFRKFLDKYGSHIRCLTISDVTDWAVLNGQEQIGSLFRFIACSVSKKLPNLEEATFRGDLVSIAALVQNLSPRVLRISTVQIHSVEVLWGRCLPGLLLLTRILKKLRPEINALEVYADEVHGSMLVADIMTACRVRVLKLKSLHGLDQASIARTNGYLDYLERVELASSTVQQNSALAEAIRRGKLRCDSLVIKDLFVEYKHRDTDRGLLNELVPSTMSLFEIV